MGQGWHLLFCQWYELAYGTNFMILLLPFLAGSARVINVKTKVGVILERYGLWTACWFRLFASAIESGPARFIEWRKRGRESKDKV